MQQQQQQKQRLIQQQQQKQRLLQQQQQQKIMVVTTNAATLPTPDPTAALQTIDSLLNNTGPPNVALQVIKTLNIRGYILLQYTMCFSAFLKCT